MTNATTPPRAAAILGAAGLVPALFAAAMAWFSAPDLAGTGLQLGLTYGALILSFLGGMWWGIASTRRPAGPLWSLLGLAVVPSLFSLGCLLLAGSRAMLAMVLLAVGVLMTLPVDRLLAGAGLAPAWWMRLRIPLSIGLSACLFALAAALTR